jgi:hypoxanthine phosphoribosyltransferase
MPPPAFAHDVERELAAVLDELGISWEYEPHTFVLATNPDGSVRDAFTPDFYLPEQDLYVECTTMRQRLTSRKHRRIKALRTQGRLVTVLCRRDFERLRATYGFPFEIAA